MYIGDYLARRELYSPDKLAFIDAGKSPEWRLTFRDANRRANKLANWLKSQGAQKGDRVAILARDGYEHLDLFFACSSWRAVGKFALNTPHNIPYNIMPCETVFPKRVVAANSGSTWIGLSS